MNNDEKVRVSLEQAIEVQNALRRNNLTLDDLKVLTSGQNMAHALAVLRRGVKDIDLVSGASDSILDMQVRDFIEQAQCPSFTPESRVVLIRRLKGRLDYNLVADLVRARPEDLLNRNHLGKGCLNFVREALKEHGLHLRGDA